MIINGKTKCNTHGAFLWQTYLRTDDDPRFVRCVPQNVKDAYSLTEGKVLVVVQCPICAKTIEIEYILDD